MKKINTILVLLFILMSCDEKPEFTVMYPNLEMRITNMDGHDLMDQTKEYAIDTANIKLYYDIDGEAIYQYSPTADAPRHFNLNLSTRGAYIIGFFINQSTSGDDPITYIEWPDGVIDTIQVELYKPHVNYSKIWLNGDIVAENGNSSIVIYK